MNAVLKEILMPYQLKWVEDTARFKIGRHQLRRSVYDFVVSDPEEAQTNVSAVFDVIEKMITSIR